MPLEQRTCCGRALDTMARNRVEAALLRAGGGTAVGTATTPA
jgi:hypothetical protein